MILYTSCHLMKKNGVDYLDHDWAWKVWKLSDGDETTPIPLKLVLDNTSLVDALWCLRCVHDEQVYAARKSAMMWTVEAAVDAARFHRSGILTEFARVASDRLTGLATPRMVKEARCEVWNRIPRMPQPSRWSGWLVWLALGERPERRADDAMEAYRLSVEPMVDTRGWRECHGERINSFLRVTFQKDEHPCSGPGMYDPTAKLPEAIQRKEARVRKPVPKRRWTFITRKPKGVADGI